MHDGKKLSRRNLLKGVLFAGGGLAFSGGLWRTLSQIALAQPDRAEERFYVFAYFDGGWDTLLGLDPRDPSAFNADNVSATRITPGYEQQAAAEFRSAPAFAPGTDILLGPAARPLDTVADRLTVIRGMSMDTLTHEVGRRRFLTGKPPAGLTARGSAASAWLAAQFGADRLIPNLSVNVESFNPDLSSEVSAIRVGSASDMVTMLRRFEPLLDPSLALAVDEHLDREASCVRSQRSPTLRAAESARRRVRAVVEANVQAYFDFESDDPEIVALRDRYGFTKRELGSGAAQAALAYQAITQGVARVVSIRAASGLDTHFNNWERLQGPRQREGFEAIATLARHLAETEYGSSGESMLDRTYIVAFSEFMRTPLINSFGGRDHWLTNCCAIIGGKLRRTPRTQLIGASSDVGMAPQRVDLETGRVTEDPERGEVIYPEHIWRTLLVDAGMTEDRADLRVPPISVLLGA